MDEISSLHNENSIKSLGVVRKYVDKQHRSIDKRLPDKSSQDLIDSQFSL